MSSGLQSEKTKLQSNLDVKVLIFGETLIINLFLEQNVFRACLNQHDFWTQCNLETLFKRLAEYCFNNF